MMSLLSISFMSRSDKIDISVEIESFLRIFDEEKSFSLTLRSFPLIFGKNAVFFKKRSKDRFLIFSTDSMKILSRLPIAKHGLFKDSLSFLKRKKIAKIAFFAKNAEIYSLYFFCIFSVSFALAYSSMVCGK